MSEYGLQTIYVHYPLHPFGLTDSPQVSTTQVWMSHSDQVTKVPEGAFIIASTPQCPAAVIDFSLCRHPSETQQAWASRLQDFLFHPPAWALRRVHHPKTHPESAMSHFEKVFLKRLAIQPCQTKDTTTMTTQELLSLAAQYQTLKNNIAHTITASLDIDSILLNINSKLPFPLYTQDLQPILAAFNHRRQTHLSKLQKQEQELLAKLNTILQPPGSSQ